MIRRRLASDLTHALRKFPAVALLGARQTGKTTLARRVAEERKDQVVFLDLERPSDLARVSEPELFLQRHADRLVILDEIHRVPELFPVLRSLIDDKRRPGRFLILGSASPELLRQSSESLAGRITHLELTPFSIAELPRPEKSGEALWERGGFPLSFLAASSEDSLAWRDAFIRTVVERDLPGLGVRVPGPTIERFWMMLAHCHGQLWNASKIAASLGIAAPTVRHYLDILRGTFMVRELPPYHANLKKRLVKAPKVYVRDSGILHALLGIPDMNGLLGHPVAGASWEGWVMEQILALAPRSWRASFFRTSAGAEIDLVLERPDRKKPLAFEIKRSVVPRPSSGFWTALADIGARGHVIAPVRDPFPLKDGVEVWPVRALPQLLEQLAG